MGEGAKRVAGYALLVACMLCLGASPAAADDANSVPPSLELRPSGTEREPLNVHSGSLAYYETAEPEVSWGYPKGSQMTFACFVDGSPVKCSKTYYDSCCPVSIQFRRSRLLCPRRTGMLAGLRPRRGCPPSKPTPPPYVPEGRALGYGPFTGWVPVPADIADGTHTITVIAADEDGADPNPPTVTAVVDRTPPSAPRILVAPPRRSTDETPRFKFTASDDKRLYDDYNDPFSAQLRRVKPAGPAFGSGAPFGNYLEWRGPSCPTPRRCTEVVWPAHSEDLKNGTTVGVRERLAPGLYELSVAARDAASNESRPTRYRFRIKAGGR